MDMSSHSYGVRLRFERTVNKNAYQSCGAPHLILYLYYFGVCIHAGWWEKSGNLADVPVNLTRALGVDCMGYI